MLNNPIDKVDEDDANEKKIEVKVTPKNSTFVKKKPLLRVYAQQLSR